MKHLFNLSAAIAILAALVACNKMEIPSTEDSLQNGKRTCKLEFNGEVSGYDGSIVRSPNTKGSSSWKEGDVIYITFFDGETIIPGTAAYSESTGWNITYDADLPQGSNLNCEVRFFVNSNFADVISITANLTPKSGRIRFSGNAGDEIFLTGISAYTTFSPAANKFTTSAAMVPLTVAADGYTPYVYGVFTYDDRKISIIGSDFAYTRNCKDSVFLPGDSGYMAIPSKTSHNSWRSGLYITVKKVDFKLLPVTGHEGGFFLLGETEITGAQFDAIFNESHTASRPVMSSYLTWSSFITKLNDATTLAFYIPSVKEWQYAAHGGNLSMGYTYAGSNTPGDVAWYSGNAKGNSHDVKLLAPNELGFYDMSGNVDEFTSSTINNNSGYVSHYTCGGGYGSEESALQWDATYYYPSHSPDYNYSAGLRIALKCL